ncbi:MAG TPA: hypothetical protein PLX59_06840 [Candidatus Cloacimonadota bacterium]|nr:hypothetical protein [Candidatus Cloacimonadota bacterium]
MGWRRPVAKEAGGFSAFGVQSGYLIFTHTTDYAAGLDFKQWVRQHGEKALLRLLQVEVQEGVRFGCEARDNEALLNSNGNSVAHRLSLLVTPP